jgi:hypothetical protein
MKKLLFLNMLEESHAIKSIVMHQEHREEAPESQRETKISQGDKTGTHL